MSVRLGELLTKASLISQDQLKEALKVQKETGGKLGETLIKLGFVSEAVGGVASGVGVGVGFAFFLTLADCAETLSDGIVKRTTRAAGRIVERKVAILLISSNRIAFNAPAQSLYPRARRCY